MENQINVGVKTLAKAYKSIDFRDTILDDWHLLVQPVNVELPNGEFRRFEAAIMHGPEHQVTSVTVRQIIAKRPVLIKDKTTERHLINFVMNGNIIKQRFSVVCE